MRSPVPTKTWGPFGLGAVIALVSLSCSTTARIDDVSMALDGAANRKREVFFTDTVEIHCVIQAGIGRNGVTIEALIREVQRYDFTSRMFVGSDRVVAQAEDAPTPTASPTLVDLQMDKPDNNAQGPFEAGRYVCEARLDGDLQGSATFNIDFPDCPTAEITVGTLCQGFYELGKVCPAYGASSTEPATCTCQTAGWSCP
jgi:hypothetical protein